MLPPEIAIWLQKWILWVLSAIVLFLLLQKFKLGQIIRWAGGIAIVVVGVMIYDWRENQKKSSPLQKKIQESKSKIKKAQELLELSKKVFRTLQPKPKDEGSKRKEPESSTAHIEKKLLALVQKEKFGEAISLCNEILRESISPSDKRYFKEVRDDLKNQIPQKKNYRSGEQNPSSKKDSGRIL